MTRSPDLRRRRPARAVTTAAVCAAALLVPLPPAVATGNRPADPPVTATTGDPVVPTGTTPRPALPDADALRRFFDTSVPPLLDQHHVPGAVVAVVGGGRTVMTGGYGLADLERDAPADPDRTLVRLASISKLVTWTAVMQLVEQGQLDLHTDVNRYLRAFEVPDTYPEPVTLAHLMSHTAGFEERTIGVGGATAADVPPLAAYLADHLPTRIRPPGQVAAYSNHGAALAGHIVAEVSGMPYERYVAEHVFAPLGMGRSTAEEPVPDHLAPDLAASYRWDDGYERIPFVFDKLVPDGSTTATAADTARFMLAHLGAGRGGDQPSRAGRGGDQPSRAGHILGDEAMRAMHRTSFRSHPEVDGWAHGFKERTFNGHRVLMHDGSWEGFQGALVLVPDRDIGLFVSFNGAGGIEALGDLLPAFADRFLPAGEPTPTGRSGTVPELGAGTATAGIEGFYRPTRTSVTTVEKLLTLMGPSRLRVDDGGRLRFSGRDWEPVGPDLYREVDGPGRLAVTTVDGRTVVATDGPAYERLHGHETIPFNGAVLALFVVASLTALVGWPTLAVLRRVRRRRSDARHGPEGARSRAGLFPRSHRSGTGSGEAWGPGVTTADDPLGRARWFGGAGCAVGLVFVAATTSVLLGDTGAFLYGAPLAFRALLVLPVAFVGLAAATAVATVTAWRRAAGGIAGRLHLTAVLVAMAGLAWFLHQWNLLGWRFG